MGDRDRPGLDAMQRGQGRDAVVCQGRAGRDRGVTIWRRRVLRASLLCLLTLVLSLAYAIATGRPVPETAGRLLSVFVQLLLGGM